MTLRQLFAWMGLSALVVVMVAVLLLPGPETKPEVSTRAVSSDRVALEAFLNELKRTWQPHEKAKLLGTAVASIDRFRAPLLEILKEPHPLRLQAIQLAGALEVSQSREAIALLATQGPEHLRPPAILAVERLSPWSRTQLLGFLEDKPAVVRAALQLCASRDDRPLAEILRLLSHEDADVREAAIAAIPQRMSASGVMDLLVVARSATDDQALHIIRALGRTNRVSKVERFLVNQLDADEPAIRMAALDALTAGREPLRRSALVWQFALNGDVDLTERAKALVCLEQTRSFEVARVREELPRLHPYLTYFAARCLIQAGQKDGISALIDLLELPKGQFGLEDDRVDAVLYATRRLLTDLSKIAPQSDPGTWRRWSKSLVSVRPRSLGSPPLDLKLRESTGTASSPR